MSPAVTRSRLQATPRCAPTCLGWAVFNGDEIQRCDACCPPDVTDDDVAALPEAQAALLTALQAALQAQPVRWIDCEADDVPAGTSWDVIETTAEHEVDEGTWGTKTAWRRVRRDGEIVWYSRLEDVPPCKWWRWGRHDRARWAAHPSRAEAEAASARNVTSSRTFSSCQARAPAARVC